MHRCDLCTQADVHTHPEGFSTETVASEAWLSISLQSRSRGLQPGVENGEGPALLMAEAFTP